VRSQQRLNLDGQRLVAVAARPDELSTLISGLIGCGVEDGFESRPSFRIHIVFSPEVDSAIESYFQDRLSEEFALPKPG